MEPLKNEDNKSRNTGGPAGQLPGEPTYKGRSDVTGIIGNLVPVNSGIRTPQNFSKNYMQFWHDPSERFASLTQQLALITPPKHF
jgi:hypothetical protein